MNCSWKMPLALGVIVALAGAGIAARAQQGRWDRPMGAHAMRFTMEDRAAFFDARIAGLKAGLRLTPDQEKLWPAAEAALRDTARGMMQMGEKMRASGRPADPIEGLRRAADDAAARADMMHKLADAAQPLYASLSEDQRARVPVLLRGMAPGGMGPGGMGRGMRGMDRGGMMGPEGDDGAPEGPAGAPQRN